MGNYNSGGPTPGGSFSTYGISVPTVIKSSFGVLFRISVTTAGTTAGTAYDFNSVTSPVNEIGTIPATLGVTEFVWPVSNGIVIIPGSGQVVSVSFE